MNEYNSLAGALIFAWETRDGGGWIEALRAVRDSGNYAAVIAALTATAANALVQLHDDDWVDALSAALLDAASEEVDGGAAELG